MHLASFATRTSCQSLATWAIVAGIVFGLVHTAPAQVTGLKPAPIAIHNNTNMTITFRFRSIENESGTYRPTNLSLVVPPGKCYMLLDDSRNKVLARKYDYDVETPGRTTSWTAAHTQPDTHGYFCFRFSPENLQTHLGVQNTPMLPPPQALPIPSKSPPATGEATLHAWNWVQSSWTVTRRELLDIQTSLLRWNRNKDMLSAWRGFSLRLKGVARKNVDPELLATVDAFIGFVDSLEENETVDSMGAKLKRLVAELTPLPVMARQFRDRYGIDFPIPKD